MVATKYVFRNLVFEGGGVKGIAYVGALEVLDKKGILGGIERVAGTSAGAITASLLACGFSVGEIRDILWGTDFNRFKDDSFFFLSNIVRLIKKFGWYKGDAFRDWFEEVISRRVPRNVTFAQLEDLRKGDGAIRSLYVVGTNLDKRTSVVFSHESHPDMKISDAVRISMSIPLFFKSVTNDFVFVDGGLYYNYPVNVFDHVRYLGGRRNYRLASYDTRKGVVYNRETLGLRVDSADEIIAQRSGSPVVKRVDSFSEYIGALVGSLVEISNRKHLHKNDWHRTVYIENVGGIRATDFDLSDSKKQALVSSGLGGARAYFRWFDSAKGSNRPFNK